MLGSSSSRVGRGSKLCRFLAGTVVQQEVHSALGYDTYGLQWLCGPGFANMFLWVTFAFHSKLHRL